MILLLSLNDVRKFDVVRFANCNGDSCVMRLIPEAQDKIDVIALVKNA
jgi:hypothetical protein